LSTKIAALSAALVLASLLALSALFYAFSAGMIRRNALAASEESARVAAAVLEDRIRGVLRLTFASFASGAKQQILETFLAEPTPANTAAALTEIAGRFIDVTTSDPFIASIYLDTPKGAFYPFSDMLRPGFSLRGSDLFKEAEPFLAEGPYWGPARKDPIFADDRLVVPMVLLYNLPGRAEDLLLVLMLDAGKIREALESSLPDNAQLLLLDASGSSVLSADGEPAELMRVCAAVLAESETEKSASAAPIRLGGRNALMTWRNVEVAPWTLVDARSLGPLEDDLKRMRSYALLASGFLLLLGLALSAAIAGGTTRQLRRLEAAMRKAEAGDLGVRCAIGAGDEVAWLGGRFNSMLDQIETLVGALNGTISELEAQRSALREEQAKKRRAELSALQAQINPHFLYNTLNTIIWMADRKGAGEIAELAANLGSFFRLSLNRGIELISVADELDQVRSYLAVQRARYGDAVAFRVESDGRVDAAQVVKLVVQPLVENSIEHGIMAGTERGSILVSASAGDDGSVSIRVEDDGVGMDRTALEAVNARLASGEGCCGDGYGIFNVNERLRLEYGEPWGLRYEQHAGGGLRAELRFPLRTEGGFRGV
jgi:two-component system sensor histidine kinase YesM